MVTFAWQAFWRERHAESRRRGGSENHVENNTEDAMETPDRIRKSIQMLLDGCGDPRELAAAAACIQKVRSLAVDMLYGRVRVEDVRTRINYESAH